MKHVPLKLTALALTFLLCLALLPAALAEEAAPETFTSGDFEYLLLEDGTAEIKKYHPREEENAVLSIPDALDGYPVTRIGDDAFAECAGLTGVTIPDSVIAVGTNPFRHCEKLVSIKVSPDQPTLAVIDGVLFEKSTKTLICYPIGKSDVSYRIPQGIARIGVWAFSGCSSLTSVHIPDSVKVIGDSAFRACSSLTGVSIPDSVASLGDGVFAGCSRLVSVSLPEGVTVLGEEAFAGCTRLTSVSLPDSVTAIGNAAFSGCSSLTGVTLPDGVTSIGDSAFRSCSSLASVSLPDGVTSIGDAAFFGCSSLASANIPSGVTAIADAVFSGCSSLAGVVLPEGVTAIGHAAFRSSPGRYWHSGPSSGFPPALSPVALKLQNAACPPFPRRGPR